SPRVVLAAASVEDCFYIAIEAARIARKYSTPVFILSDTSLATRIEAFDEPDLSKLMVDPKPDLTPREGGFKPYDLERITQHIPPGARILDGKYPLIGGLEHDEMGHPTGSPKLHMAMTAKRRNKLRKLAEEIPVPEVYGDGQLATILRARYCESKIQSVTKTDGLTFRVKEILQGVFPGKFVSVRGYSPNRPVSGNGEQDVDVARAESIAQGVG